MKVPSVSKTVSKQETAEKLFQTVNQLIREIGKVVE
ncbi:unknown [Clostridium sp. CAG:75]|nr:unknown [Clostridium sp. CAG:75]